MNQQNSRGHSLKVRTRLTTGFRKTARFVAVEMTAVGLDHAFILKEFRKKQQSRDAVSTF
jgi:hypothetical protein